MRARVLKVVLCVVLCAIGGRATFANSVSIEGLPSGEGVTRQEDSLSKVPSVGSDTSKCRKDSLLVTNSACADTLLFSEGTSASSGCFALPSTLDKHAAKALKDSLWRDSIATLSGWRRFNAKVDRFTSTKFYQMTYIAVPLIVAGAVLNGERNHFSDLRNTYLPTFRHEYDDYVQYLPMATMFGLKLAGVKGRSSWGRMLVSDAFSALLTTGFVMTLKNTVNQMRPDDSQNNSFPSGHTATAFMAATMLHKEYGMTRSPWYSIGGYTVATFVGVSRQMNNKHWLSDVLAGAGFGILATELGYYFADLIFKDKGLLHPEIDFSSFDYNRKSSFFGLYVGFNWVHRQLPTVGNLALKTGMGSAVGLEGAWFINRYVGIGSRVTLGSMTVSMDNDLYFGGNDQLAQQVTRFEISPMRMVQVMAGPYFNLPLSKRWSLGSKLLVGYHHLYGASIKAVMADQRVVESKMAAGAMSSFAAPAMQIPALSPRAAQIAAQRAAENQQVVEKKQMLVSMESTRNFGFGTGLSLNYIVNRNFGVRFFYDCNFSPASFRVSQYQLSGSSRTSDINQFVTSSMLGASVNIYFW